MPRIIAYVGLGLLYLLIIGCVGSLVGAFIHKGSMGGEK
jgi:hypothetical protein